MMTNDQNAHEPSLVENKVEIDPTGPRHLTASQTKAFVELCAFSKLSGGTETYGGFNPRAKPLLIGPSGAGKTALVTRVCDTERLPLLVVNSGSWIVVSAKAEPYTLHVIRRFVRENDKGCIFLDEIDKCCPSGPQAWASDWTLSITTELLALLDGQRLLTSGWTREDTQRLANFFIIGAGAWQRKVKRDGIQAQAKRMARDPGIPQEITLRFNARLILIEPPNDLDFQKAIERVHGDLSLAKPDGTVLKQLVAQAVQARCGLRWVEQYVSDLLVFHPHLRRASEPHPQPSSGKRVIPAYEMKAEIENLYGLLEAAEPSISHLKAKMTLMNRRLKQRLNQAQTLLNLDESVMTPQKWDQVFTDFLLGLHSRYYRSDLDRADRHAKLHTAGQQIWDLCQSLLQEQSSAIEADQMMPLVVQAAMRVSRILSALSYLSTVELFDEKN